MISFAWLILISATSPGVGDDPQSPVRSESWRADPAFLADLEKRKTSWLYREELVKAYALPDPLICADGSRITTAKEWERQRRPETLELFRKFVYGRSPALPVDVSFVILTREPKALNGAATLKRVRITSRDGNGKSFAFEAAVLVPNRANGPVPAFLLINNREVANADPTRSHKDGFWPAEALIARGFAAAVFRTSDVDPDNKDEAARKDGVRGVWPTGGGGPGTDAWGTIAAWAWGASRVLDYLRSDPAISAAKVAVVGHSRGGKTALWAAAEDQRFALAISNGSGRVGASLARRRFGETVEAINHNFPHWFSGNFRRFNGKENELPVDQHQLLALIAPRAVYVASADRDLWADPHGEFLALAHARPVYALYGHEGFNPEEMPPLDTSVIRGRTGYHIRRGGHNLTPHDWDRFMDFADRLWRGSVP